MIAQKKWILLRASRRPWFRASLFSLLGIATALLALALEPYIPDDLPTKVGSEAVDNILGIIASSMLAVTTFSLSIMVTAFGSATNNVTPHATPLLVEDPTTQNVLSTFIGSFIFSLVGIIALSTGVYSAAGRVVLFVVTLLVVVLIIYSLLRWIDKLSKLGRVGETTDRVEKAATKALRRSLREPCLGGDPLPDTCELPASARPVHATEVGYVQHIDMQALAALTKPHGCAIYVHAVPGSFVEPSQPILYASGIDAQCDDSLRAAFTLGARRTFDHDPRFGIAVLSEIASRALSPGVNDPGTAVDVIGCGVRVLSLLTDPSVCEAPQKPSHTRVFVPRLNVDDLFDDFFTPIARDGAGQVEIGIRLQTGLASLGRLGNTAMKEAAARHARLALKRAEASLALPEDLQRVRHLANGLSEPGLPGGRRP